MATQLPSKLTRLLVQTPGSIAGLTVVQNLSTRSAAIGSNKYEIFFVKIKFVAAPCALRH
jgi:hypothetical protein